MKKLKLGFLLSTLLASAASYAAPGAYVGVNLGSGRMDTPDVDLASLATGGATSASDELGGGAGSIDLGYLWGQEKLNYGIELGASKYADNKYTVNYVGETLNRTYKGYNVDLMGVIKYNFESRYNVFAKGGAAYTSQEFDVDKAGVLNNHSSDKNHKILPKIELGVGYDYQNGFGVNVAYSHIFGDSPAAFTDSNATADDLNKVASVDMFTIGVTYRF
ncbi:porin family protein [Vibrio sp. S4M6]|uniref:outer membrane protein n=1 Tax=Vibrio sinus TaxID=2946865 RepID=UPI00202AABF6|nr:porin family protein [Vibrio sinus]MCL9780167.1 porin family protein [Vibrio sinus]